MLAGVNSLSWAARKPTSTFEACSSGSTPIVPQASLPSAFRKPRSSPTRNLGTLDLQVDASLAGGRRQGRERLGSGGGRVVVGPTLDHRADLDRDRALVTGPRHGAQVA